MSQIPFDELPDHARLWVFAADRELTAEEARLLSRFVTEGLAEWNAHGSPVRWGFRVAHERFLLIGVDETTTALSGCSIDSATRRLRDAERALGMSLLDNGRVFYRDGESIARADRAEFRELARAGRVGPETVVFNNVIATVGELRRGDWQVPMRRSWHAEAFPVGAR